MIYVEMNNFNSFVSNDYQLLVFLYILLENIINNFEVNSHFIVKIWYNGSKGDSLIYDIRLSSFLI